MKCRYCGNTIKHFEKFVHNGPVQGKTYHYRAYCECGKSYYTKRTAEIYRAVKDQEWKHGSAVKKKKNLAIEF
jgi:hypothetical protein